LREVIIVNDKVQIGETSFVGCTSLERFKFPNLSTRLDNVIQAGQRDIETKLDNIPAVEWRSGELSIPSVHQEIIDDDGWEEMSVEVDEEKLDKVKGLIAYYEVKEATTLFELALWNAKMNQVHDTSLSNREPCRVEVPGPVKDTILQYLQ